MNILIDIGHPAHVHYFRNLYQELQGRHNITVTCKSIPIVLQLLNAYGIPYTVLGDKGSSLAVKAIRQLKFTRQIIKLINEKKIDLAMGLSFSVVQAAKLSNAESLLFDDDDQALQPITARFITPYADNVISPDVLAFEGLNNAIYYPGFQELAYLHPKYFSPNPAVLAKYGLSALDKYFILRFSALKAHHDVMNTGLSKSQKKALIALLSLYGKVFITMEDELDPEFAKYQIPIAPEEMHDFLSFSQMLVCDGQTMCTEAAMLGVPSFRCNSFAGRVSVLEEEEKKYGLTFAFLPRQFDWMLYRIAETLTIPKLKEEWKRRRDILLKDKINVTAFWVWFLNEYPCSVAEVKKPGFNYDRFR